jgi:hypothetical protein
MSQDLAGLQSPEVVDEARNPRGAGASAEETPLPMHRETPKAMTAGAPVD